MGRRLVAVIVVSALVMSACNGSSDGAVGRTDDRSPEPASTVSGDDASDDDTSSDVMDGSPTLEADGLVAQALAGAGVVIRDAPAEPSDPRLELLSFQVASLERQAASGHGITGAALDDLLGAPGGLPISFLIAAWLQTAPTPAATEAAALMGEQPWEQAPNLVFPTAVLALFTADAVAAAGGAGASSARGLVGPASPYASSVMLAGLSTPSAVSGVCSDLSDWFGSILDFLFESLEADTDGFFGFLAEIWNAAIDLARATVGGVIELLTAPVVAVLAEVIGVIGTLSMVASLLVPWNAELTESDPRPAFAVGDGPDNAQRFTLRVDPNLDLEWPAEVEDCAAVAGFDLPDPGEAVGSPVDWNVVGLPPNGAETGRQSTLDDENRATFDWVTGREESSDGDEAVGVVSATATVTSTQIEALRSMLQSLLAGFVPVAPFGEIVAELFVDLAGPVFDRFAALVQVSGSTSVRVVRHEIREPIATVPPATTAPPTIDISAIDPCTVVSFEEASGGLLGTPTETQNVGEPVSFSGFGAVGCRFYTQLSPRLEQYLSVSISLDGDGRLDSAGAWNPWGRWDSVPLADVGDGAWQWVSNGSFELGSPAGTIHGIVVAQQGALVQVSVSHSYPESPDGFVAIAELVFERIGAGA